MDRKLDFLTKDLVDQAVTQIEKNGIPSNRVGTEYEVNIRNKQYPYKLLVTEAAKLSGINLKPNDFSSNVNNRSGFEEITGYRITDLNQKMEYFNLNGLLNYKKDVGKKYDSNNKGTKTYFDTRSKLKYLGRRLGNKLGLKLVNNYNEKPNKMAGHGKGFVLKEYILTGFLPANLRDNGNDIFIKLSFHGFNTNLEFGVDIDVNFSDDNNQFKKFRKQLQDEAYWRVPVNNNFPTDWDDLIDLVEPHFKTQINYLEEFFLNLNNMNAINDYIKILEFKKQIILQGPPGTGKTYTAKKIAKELTGINTLRISDSFIRKTFSVGQKIENASGIKDFYSITDISDEGISMRSDKSRSWTATYERIISKYEDFLHGKKPSNRNGKDPYEIAIAQHLFKNVDTNEKGDYELIQFHPSYTYEDFVRGIEAISNGEKIEYRTRNKKIAQLAKTASENLENSQKSEEELTEKILLDERFEAFVEMINDKVDEEGSFPLTPSVSIVGIDEDAFRYKGENGWNNNGNKMHFSDIKKAYLDNNKTRQDIKNNKTLSGLANWHASYYVRVLNEFQEFNDKMTENIEVRTEDKNEKLKKYVLIIDEINRANLPSVLGELIYALEYRGEMVNSMYEVNGKSELVIPENLYIIGTMNTADRSVGHIDYAIRRRFSFVEILADSNIIQNVKAKGLFDEVSNLFIEEKDGELVNSKYLAPDFNYRDIQIGHSYFLVDPTTPEIDQLEELRLKLNYEIKPILREYVNDGILLKDAETAIEKLSV